MPNPFYYGGAIHNPRYFVGRREELRQIFAALTSLAEGREAQHVNIHGPRRIGKSSLLIRVQQSAPDHGMEKHPFLYLDAQEIQDPRDFFRCVLEGLAAPAVPEPHTVAQVLRRLPAPPVLLLDELGVWLRHPERFDSEFYERLRAWMNQGLLALVVASTRPLAELQEDASLSSPFFNIFGTLIPLGPLPPEEAEELLEKGRACDRPFTEEEVNWLKRWAREGAGYHPARLQLAAWELYEAKARPPVDLRALETRLNRRWEHIEGRAPRLFPRPLRRSLRRFLSWPAPLGRAVAEMAGRREISPFTEIVVGWWVVILIGAVLAGWIPWRVFLDWLLRMLNP